MNDLNLITYETFETMRLEIARLRKILIDVGHGNKIGECNFPVYPKFNKQAEHVIEIGSLDDSPDRHA